MYEEQNHPMHRTRLGIARPRKLITCTGMQLGTSEGNVFDGVAMMIE